MTSPQNPIHFGPYEVTKQVFLTTAHTFALVNLKPLLPGHVLVCTSRPHKRLTDLSPPELTDLMLAVQRVQRMLARHYFLSSASSSPAAADPTSAGGSFNIALQDGAEAGQTVPHVHVHVIPRIRGSTERQQGAAEGPGDELYEGMAGEDGNVGGALWDREVVAAAAAAVRARLGERPTPGGGFPSIEDAERGMREMGDMEAEAEVYRGVLKEMEREEES